MNVDSVACNHDWRRGPDFPICIKCGAAETEGQRQMHEREDAALRKMLDEKNKAMVAHGCINCGMLHPIDSVCPPKPAATASMRQVGGNHYRTMSIQPHTYIWANGIGFHAGTAIAYLSRYEKKGGSTDLRKAIHMIELLLELVVAAEAERNQTVPF